MSIQQDIKKEIVDAMKAKDQPRLLALRSLSSAFTNELVKLGRKPQDELSDDEAMAVITRSVKQRKDSIEQFKNAGRDDLVAEEEAQLPALEKFLPAMMDRAEVEAIARAKKDELGITDKTKQGMLMSALMKDLKGKADGSTVKEVVESILVD